jgi:nucleotide-binding universal stress UspA family protein
VGIEPRIHTESMLQLRRLLFPTDLSTCAERAFTHAAYLAERAGAELHVLHVIEENAEAPGDWVGDFRITPEDLAADLHLPMPPRPDKTADTPLPLVDAEIRADRAAPGILRYADEHDIDLIVMGTHGRRGVRRLLMGSTAEEVVRLARCPVFTVGGERDQGAGGAVRRIVAPMDRSEHAMQAARHAGALATLYGATLDLLHVLDAAAVPTATGPIVGLPLVSAEEIERRTRAWLKQQASVLAEAFPDVGTVGAFVRVGRPASDIVDFSEERGADLLVLGSHGRSGLKRLLMGSVAGQVIRSASCPVFTIKSFGRLLLPEAPVTSEAAVAQRS